MDEWYKELRKSQHAEKIAFENWTLTSRVKDQSNAIACLRNRYHAAWLKSCAKTDAIIDVIENLTDNEDFEYHPCPSDM